MQPSPDAVAEFKVVTNNMSAEYGRAGGATINVAYQSGTNQFKGSVWEFFRDTSLNATGFFKPLGGEKPPMRRNQFGGVLGGPIVKNKAFFLVDYEGLPSEPQAGRLRNHSHRGPALGHPVRARCATRSPAVTYPAGTQIPMTPFAAKVLAGIPSPTTASRREQLPDPPGVHEREQQVQRQGRLPGDQRACAPSPATATASRTSSTSPCCPCPRAAPATASPTPPTSSSPPVSPGRRAIVNSSSSASPGRARVAGKNPPALGTPSAAERTESPACPTDPRVSGGLPTQLITGFADLGRQATNPQWQYPTVFNPKLNYTRSAGRHSLKVGIEFQHIQTEVQDVNPLYGRDTYTGQFSRPAGSSANNIYNLADFMFGLRSQYALTNFFIANLRQNLFFGYLQDDFKVNNKLTLNLGLRYEYATPQWERDNNATNFDPATR